MSLTLVREWSRATPISELALDPTDSPGIYERGRRCETGCGTILRTTNPGPACEVCKRRLNRGHDVPPEFWLE